MGIEDFQRSRGWRITVRLYWGLLVSVAAVSYALIYLLFF